MKQIGLLVLSVAVLFGCTQSGIQGSSLFSSFNGITNVEVLSPTAVKLSWGLDSKYQTYNIYLNDSSSVIKQETFSTTVMKELQPGTTYTFKVTGVKFDSSEPDQPGTRSATTFTVFPGLKSIGVVLKSPTEVNLTWDVNSPITEYRVYAKKQSATWNLAQPQVKIVGAGTTSLQNLTAGDTYCFYVQANYKDSTFEPAATSETAINALAPCVQMTSQMQSLPTVTVNSAVPGPFPWFWTANGDPSYKTEVFESGSNERVATIIGNGTFRAFAKASEGNKTYYAQVSKGTEVAPVDVLRYGDVNKTSTKVRTISATGNKGPVFPGLMNGGHGPQLFGKKVVSGDFNCDGLTDVAVSMPSAVITPSINHYSETGAIVVYYSHIPAGPCFDDANEPTTCPVELNTSVTPSAAATFPNPTLITYPATSDRMRLGSEMATGNFNGDCFQRDSGNARAGNCNDLYRTETVPTEARLSSIRSCDDLVISVDDGTSIDPTDPEPPKKKGFYVIYGDHSFGLITGSGATTAGIDEFTCDTFSNSCRVVLMTAPTGLNRADRFAASMTTGDYNNDGYDELLVGTSGAADQIGVVIPYRGGPQGLYPYGVTGNHAIISATLAPTTASLTSFGAFTALDLFGAAVGTAYDSRVCVNGTPAGYVYRPNPPADRLGYDFKKCDDVVIGAPGRSMGRGSIFTCKGEQASTDKQRITSWTCQETFPTSLTGKVALYGSSIAGARNFNGYPVYAITSDPTDTTKEVPDVTGAVFVGAPGETITVGSTEYAAAGAVYGYYITPGSTNNGSGGIQGILGSSSAGHPIESVNQVPCDKLNRNKVTGSLYHCNNQKITMSPLEANATFGAAMNALPILAGQSVSEESMKMLAVSAPNRSVSSNNSSGSISGAGSVFLYKADVSTFGTDATGNILSPKKVAGTETNDSCTNKCTWYSGGLSPYGASVFYPYGLTKDAKFGLGGVVGGNFDAGTEGDVIASAPSLNYPTPQNGGVFLFRANVGFAPTENTPLKSLYAPMGLEGGYKFEEAKVIGDINGDGYEDVATHINANGTWSLVIYYGSAAGLIKTPSPSKTAAGTQPLLLSLSADSTFGQKFYPAGDVNGDGFKDILVIGGRGSYIYYGSLSGISGVQEPVVSPIGKGPLLFARSGQGDNDVVLDSWADGMSRASDSSYTTDLQSVASGDFNGDGFGDIAVRTSSAVLPLGSSENDMYYSSLGRVLIIYGSSAGPQVNRTTGRIQVHNGTSLVDVATADPCNTSGCKVQLIGAPSNVATTGFGYAVASARRDGSQFTSAFDRLLISDINASDTVLGADTGAVYIYEGSITGVKPQIIQTLVPRGSKTAQKFGMQIVNAGDINGDEYHDVVIASGKGTEPNLYVFYGKVIGSAIGYFGGTSLTATDYWTNNTIADNDEHTSATAPVPQVIRPVTLLEKDLLGWGIAALGDFNNDGFNDVVVNVPNGDSTMSGNIPETGFGVVFFGGAKGLQVKNLVVSPFPRCYQGTAPVCDPMQVFLPDGVAYENTSINPHSVGDINGDGYLDIVVGGVGRDLIMSDGTSATSTGVLYILY